MKRRVLAMALLGAIGAAGAQTPPSSVTLYGIFDTGVEHLTNVNAAGDSLTRMPNLTGSLPSRVGLRGSEDLGGGLRAEFTLENGFNPDDGNLGQGGRLFGRQAWVGVGGAWGGLSIGRVYTMLFWANLGADILGPNLYGLGSLDNYIPNSRSDNSIAYRGTFSGFSIGGTYSFGRDTSAAGGPAATNCPGESPLDSSRCKQWSAMLKYDASNWGLAASIDKKYGGPGAAFGLTSSSLTDTRTTYSGYFQFANKMKFGAGLLARENQGSVATPDSDLWWLGFSTPFAGSWMFETQAMMLDYDNSDNDTDLLAVRVMYSFSRRTAAYLNLGFANNDGTAAVSASSGGSVGPGMNQTGVMIGMRHFF